MSPITDLTDKVVVITGAGSGIGRGTARAFAAQGAHVVASDIDLESAEATAAELRDGGGRAIAVECDVADRASIVGLAERAWAEFGHVDVVMNNAGMGPTSRGPVLDADEADVRRLIDVHLLGAWYGCVEFGRRFVEQGTPAHIIVTGSENSIGTPAPGMHFYTASKHAVYGLCDLMRGELPDHIGVSIVLPGIVATGLTPMLGSDDDDAEPAFGINANTMGRAVVQGMLDGEFAIVAHPPVVELVDQRAAELRGAFERQAPRYDGDERLDTAFAMRKIIEQLKAGSSEG